jgi:hypothetical protein
MMFPKSAALFEASPNVTKELGEEYMLELVRVAEYEVPSEGLQVVPEIVEL